MTAVAQPYRRRQKPTFGMHASSHVMPFFISSYLAALVALIPLPTLAEEPAERAVGVGYTSTGAPGLPATSMGTLSPKEVARMVSAEPANQRFIDELDVDERFEKLEIPILVGSSVLPALTLVEWRVHDEHPQEDPNWEPSTAEELLRLFKLKVGPGRDLTDSEWSSRSSNVRMILWPSGHVLWVTNQGKDQVLRNRKGELVEYRFGKLDFDVAIKKIEKLISSERPPQGMYRKAVLYDPPGSHVMTYHKLVVTGQEYLFRTLTQVGEQQDDAFYKQTPFRFDIDRPREDVQQFVDICDVVRGMLPIGRKSYTLRSEPNYVWRGQIDFFEPPVDGEVKKRE